MGDAGPLNRQILYIFGICVNHLLCELRECSFFEVFARLACEIDEEVEVMNRHEA